MLRGYIKPIIMYNKTPDRPDSWSLEQEGFEKVTRLDYFGQPYQAWQRKTKDLGKAWAQFREQFRSQPERDTAGHHNSYNPPMEQIEYKLLNPDT
jgi:hypothetical protein